MPDMDAVREQIKQALAGITQTVVIQVRGEIDVQSPDAIVEHK